MTWRSQQRRRARAAAKAAAESRVELRAIKRADAVHLCSGYGWCLALTDNEGGRCPIHEAKPDLKPRYLEPDEELIDIIGECVECQGSGDCSECDGDGECQEHCGSGHRCGHECEACEGKGECASCGGSGQGNVQKKQTA